MIAKASLMTETPPRTVVAWHAQPPDAVKRQLDSPESGLTTTEAESRLKIHGPNQLASAKPRHPVLRFLAQFHNLLLYLMTAAGIITALLEIGRASCRE